MDDDFVCPMVWRWSEIHANLQAQWESRGDEAVAPPPAMLAPNSTDTARQARWAETVAWVEEHGFEMPPLAEQDKYYRI